MKLIAFALLIGLTLAQNPIPLPKLNLQALEGYWYIPWFTNEGNFNINNYSNTCMGLNLVLSLDSAELSLIWESSGGEIQDFIWPIGIIGDSNSSWIFHSSNGNNLTLDWIAIDPIAASWAVFTIDNGAFFLSRSPTVSSLLINSAIALLRQEGFFVNSENSFYLSQNCPQVNPGINPIPLPGLNLNNLGGEWYIPWGTNTSTQIASACISAEVGFTNQYSAAINISITIDGTQNAFNQTLGVSLSNSAVWIEPYAIIYWISADTVNYQWGLGVVPQPESDPSYLIFLVSRTSTIDASIVSNAISLVNEQGWETSNLIYYATC